MSDEVVDGKRGGGGWFMDALEKPEVPVPSGRKTPDWKKGRCRETGYESWGMLGSAEIAAEGKGKVSVKSGLGVWTDADFLTRFKSLRLFARAVDGYFKWCDDAKVGKTKDGKLVPVDMERVPSPAGLARWLGMGMREYRKLFTDARFEKYRAYLEWVETAMEERIVSGGLSGRYKSQAVDLVTKNRFGWSDKVDVTASVRTANVTFIEADVSGNKDLTRLREIVLGDLEVGGGARLVDGKGPAKVKGLLVGETGEGVDGLRVVENKGSAPVGMEFDVSEKINIPVEAGGSMGMDETTIADLDLEDRKEAIRKEAMARRMAAMRAKRRSSEERKSEESAKRESERARLASLRELEGCEWGVERGDPPSGYVVVDGVLKRKTGRPAADHGVVRGVKPVEVVVGAREVAV